MVCFNKDCTGQCIIDKKCIKRFTVLTFLTYLQYNSSYSGGRRIQYHLIIQHGQFYHCLNVFSKYPRVTTETYPPSHWAICINHYGKDNVQRPLPGLTTSV